MKYEINLLPPEALAERLEKIIKHRERLLFSAIFVAGILVLVSYGAAWVLLTFFVDSFVDQINWQNKDRATIAEQSKIINRDIGLIDARISTYTAWTARIPDVVAVSPTGIKISRIELVEKPETLVISGTASNGSDVIKYQEALEKLPWVDHVEAPLQNFARAPSAKIVFTVFHKTPSL